MHYYTSHKNNLVSDAETGCKLEEAEKKPLSIAEKSLVASLKSHYDKKGALTTRQYDLLLSILSRYSEEKLNAAISWNESFDDEKKKRFKLAVDYYNTTRYFTNIVNRAVQEPDYIPSEKVYNSMCNNKYFERALEVYNTKPKYDIGDLVVFRDNADNYHRDKSIIGLIAEVDERKVFEKGMRKYSMIILGTEDSISVFEHTIKLHREKKNV